MREKAAILLALLDQQWRVVERLFDKLEARDPSPLTSEEETIAIAYTLHNLYCALEDIFKEVAKTFENELEDPARFHAELLQRMALAIYKIRPAFVSPPSLPALQELRKFRHVFRHAYGFDLQPNRILELNETARGIRQKLIDSKDNFRKFLLQLIEEEPNSD